MQTLNHCKTSSPVAANPQVTFSQMWVLFVQTLLSCPVKHTAVLCCCIIQRWIPVTFFLVHLTENSLPKPKSLDAKVSHSVLAMKSGERDFSSVPSSSQSSSSTSSILTTPKEHNNAPVIVPLIKPSAGTQSLLQHSRTQCVMLSLHIKICLWFTSIAHQN